jgi:hypothetical protein
MSHTGVAMPDRGEFVGRTELFRRELLAHCYRILGSVDDAEDLVQETYLRAWRSYGGFEGRSSPPCSTCPRGSGRCCSCGTCWPSQPPRSPRCSTPPRRRSRARCSAPAPGSNRWPRQRTRSPSPPNRRLVRCWTGTSRPSSTPTRRPWSGCCARTPRWSCRRPRPGSPAAGPSRTPWRALALPATGGWSRPAPTGSRPPRPTTAVRTVPTGRTGSWCSPRLPQASPGSSCSAIPACSRDSNRLLRGLDT